MKKKYSKPVLAIESFQLDAAVAAACGAQAGMPTLNSTDDCLEMAAMQKYGPIYVFGNGICGEHETYDGSPVEVIWDEKECYHAPYGLTYSLINS